MLLALLDLVEPLDFLSCIIIPVLPEGISKLHMDSFNGNTIFRGDLKTLPENSHGKDSVVELFPLYDQVFLDAFQLFLVLARYVN